MLVASIVRNASTRGDGVKGIESSLFLVHGGEGQCAQFRVYKEGRRTAGADMVAAWSR